MGNFFSDRADLRRQESADYTKARSIVGQERAVFSDPLTAKAFEGYAVILECIGSSRIRHDGIPVILGRYKVSFTDSDEVVERIIKLI